MEEDDDYWIQDEFDGINKTMKRQHHIVMNQFVFSNKQRDAKIDALRMDMNTRFDSMNTRLDSMDTRLDSMDAKFDVLRHKINSLELCLHAIMLKLDIPVSTP